MSNKYTNELYEKIKGSFTEKKKGGFKNVLKTVPENTYQVRIIPNVDEHTNTLFQYYLHGWVNPETGRYTSTVCPSTYDEECPICTERFRLYNSGTTANKDLSKSLARKERFYANVLVVDDPVTPENNGTVKVLGYGAQIKKIIEEAMTGDDAEEVGGRMFDLTKEGCNLRIKVEKNKAGYPNYDHSKFIKPSAVTISAEDAMDQAHDFDPLLNRKTDDEMRDMIASICGTVVEQPAPVSTETEVDAISAIQQDKNIVDDIPMGITTEDAVDSDDIMAEFENL